MPAVTVSEYRGDPRVGEPPIPEPGAQRVVTELPAVMNPTDPRLASGEWRLAPATYPRVLGDGAACRSGRVTRFAVGDEVSLHGRRLPVANRRRSR